MNTELAQRTLDFNTGGKGGSKGKEDGDGSKGDTKKDNDIGMDLLEQRMKDANRFAFMLSAMQEQLEFEREQIAEKDEEIANLKRELALSKQMNTELAQRTLDINTGGKGDNDDNGNGDNNGNTEDKDIGMDLLEQRM